MLNNPISGEGLRYMLRHGLGGPVMEHFPTFVLAIIALGMLPSCADRKGWTRLAVWLAVVWAMLFAFVLWPQSPLRGVSGGLCPSPFVSALPVLLPLSVICVRLSSASLVGGLKRKAWWIVAYMCAAVLCNLITFIVDD